MDAVNKASFSVWKMYNQVQDVKVPNWPHVSQVAQWIIALGKHLVSASSQSDTAEISWINECKEKTFEELANSGGARFEKLDLKLSETMMRTYQKEAAAQPLTSELHIMEEKVAAAGGMIKGRHIVALILEHFKTDRHMDSMWQLEDLISMEYPGGQAPLGIPMHVAQDCLVPSG